MLKKYLYIKKAHFLKPVNYLQLVVGISASFSSGTSGGSSSFRWSSHRLCNLFLRPPSTPGAAGFWSCCRDEANHKLAHRVQTRQLDCSYKMVVWSTSSSVVQTPPSTFAELMVRKSCVISRYICF